MRTVAGAIIGGVIGFAIGGPMGAVIGAGMGAGAGAIMTPIRIQGAKVGEEDMPSVQSGTPIGIVLGEGTIKGDLLWQGPRVVVKVKEEQGGKGGSQTVENEEVQRDYAIHFCESNVRRGTKIRSVKMIRRSKIIVYDVRPESKLTAADNALFMENVTFYFGDSDQLADPTCEVHFGALGAPAYRNQFTMVVRQHLLGKFGNRIPDYEVVTCGGGDEEGGGGGAVPHEVLITGAWAGSDRFAVNLDTDPVTFAAIPSASGADISAVGTAAYGDGVWSALGTSAVGTRYSEDDRATWQTGAFAGGGPVLSPKHHVFGNSKFVAIGEAPFDNRVAISNWPPTTYTLIAVPVGIPTSLGFAKGYFYYGTQNGMMFRTLDFVTQTTINDGLGSGADYHFYFQFAEFDGYVYATRYSDDFTLSRRHQLVRSLNGLFTDTEIIINLPAAEGIPLYWLEVVGGQLVVYKSGGKILRSGDNYATEITIGLTSPPIITSGPLMLGDRKMTSSGGRLFVMGEDYDVPRQVAYSDDLATFTVTTTGQSATKSIVGTGERGAVSPTLTDDDIELPDVPGHYVDKYDGGYSGVDVPYFPAPVDDCSLSLGSMIRILSKRTQVPASALDASRVDGVMVRGASFRATSPVRNAIDTLAELYLFDVADTGGGIAIVPRGGPIDIVVEDGDILLSSKDVTKQARGQQSEYPKIATLRYVDPVQDFEESSQRSVVKTKDFRATGEKTFTVSVTMTPNEAATQITRIHAEMQDQLEGSIQFHLPIKYLSMIPSAVISYLGKRYRVTKRRVEPWKVVMDAAIHDRASTYSLTAEGTVTGHTPTPQSSLVGPTMFAPMNMPVAIDAYDRPCLQAVVQGVLPGWRGADIYIKRGTGPYELTVSNMAAGVLGELTAGIDALSAPGIDYAQVLQFKLYATGTAEPITIEQLMEEKNAFALLKPDYTVNAGQFMNATEISAQQYEATGLAWNRLDTPPASFAAGTVIAFLAGAKMIPLRSSDLGQTIKVKAVSRGSAIEAAPEHTITLTTMESQREWQPVNIRATKGAADCSWLVEITGRHRLGSSDAPIASQWWVGWRYDFTIDGVTKSHMTRTQSFDYTEALQLADWGFVSCAGYGIDVVSVNEYTGGDGTGLPGGGGGGGGGIPGPPATTPDGSAGSTTTGPNGGYADNNPPPIPPPTVFGSNVVTDPTNIANWRDTLGGPLNPIYWNMVGGELHYAGGGNTTARYQPALVRMPVQPISRYTVTFSATITTALGKKAAIGVGLEAAVFAEYPTPTPVTVVYDVARTFLSVNSSGFVDFTSAPEFHVADADGVAGGEAWVSSPDFQIDAVPVPVTQEYPAHLDFDTGVADWVAWPPDPGGYFGFSASGGVVTFTSTVDSAIIRNVYCKTPLTLPDALGKYIGVGGEVCSNSTKTISGVTWGGASFAVVLVNVATGDIVATFGGPYQRGDFTEREFWFRQHVDSPGVYSFHAAIMVRIEPGKFVKVKDLWTKTTDSVLTP